MGRKSSAKAQNRGNTGDATPPDGPRSNRAIVIAVAAIALAAAGFAYVRTGPATEQPPASARTAPPNPTDPPPYAKFGPHRQENLPPLPVQAYAPPRPPEVVRAAYLFAAEHPEVLSYVPCFCGCEQSGHRGNEDCFVARRDANGDVTEWEPHGLDCTVCIDVATEARQMFTSGASVRDIRTAIERKWGSFHGGHTPTPEPAHSH